MNKLIALSLALLSLTAAGVNRSAPVSPEFCDEMPVPFQISTRVETDSELSEWLEHESDAYCAIAGNEATAWCACYAYGLIRD